MKRKKQFLFYVLMAIVMMAMSPAKMWADNVTINANTWKQVLAEIEEARETYEETFTITFADCFNGTPIFEKSVGTGVNIYNDSESVYDYVVAPTSADDLIMAPADCSDLFQNLRHLTSVNFENFHTSNVTDMCSMFAECNSLSNISFGNHFDTSKVEDMSGMFAGCSSIEDLGDLRINTSNVEDMSSMFAGCSNLGWLYLDDFNTSKVTDMNSMFAGCSRLMALFIDKFDMSNVVVSEEYNGVEDMFNGCTNLIQLVMESLPYLVDGTFNGVSTWSMVSVVLDDNSMVYTPTEEKPNHIPDAMLKGPYYSRYMSNEWGTLVLPFDLTYEKNDNYKLYYLTDASIDGEESTLTLKEYNNGEIAACTPMVVRATGEKGSENKYYLGIDGKCGAISTDVVAKEHNGQNAYLPTNWKMNGTFASTNIQSGDLVQTYFIANNYFWKADAVTSVDPFRGWFELHGEGGGEDAKSFNIIIDENGETTAIGKFNAESFEPIEGKFLENNRIIIVKNGKKFNLNGQKVK